MIQCPKNYCKGQYRDILGVSVLPLYLKKERAKTLLPVINTKTNTGCVSKSSYTAASLHVNSILQEPLSQKQPAGLGDWLSLQTHVLQSCTQPQPQLLVEEPQASSYLPSL